jgi:hypothetical protein
MKLFLALSLAALTAGIGFYLGANGPRRAVAVEKQVCIHREVHVPDSHEVRRIEDLAAENEELRARIIELQEAKSLSAAIEGPRPSRSPVHLEPDPITGLTPEKSGRIKAILDLIKPHFRSMAEMFDEAVVARTVKPLSSFSKPSSDRPALQTSRRDCARRHPQTSPSSWVGTWITRSPEGCGDTYGDDLHPPR